MNITFQGNPVTLKGNPIKVGDKMPEFTLRANNLSDITLKDLEGVTVFITVPSLDTPVCDLEIKRFNENIHKLGNTTVYVVSMDLPFAQQRWCGANGVNAIKTLSDYVDHNFSESTGTLIEGISLLTRAVFIINSDKTVSYVQYVSEVTSQPDYDSVFEAVKMVK